MKVYDQGQINKNDPLFDYYGGFHSSYLLAFDKVMKRIRKENGLNLIDIKILSVINLLCRDGFYFSTREIYDRFFATSGCFRNSFYLALKKLREGHYIDFIQRGERIFRPNRYAINGKGQYLLRCYSKWMNKEVRQLFDTERAE